VKTGDPDSDAEAADYLYMVQLARSYTTAALRKIRTLLDSENEQVSQRAADAILDRAFGKAPQAVHVTGNITTDARSLTDEALARIAAGGSEGAAREADGTEKPSPVH
jgi:hypothetical protein